MSKGRAACACAWLAVCIVYVVQALDGLYKIELARNPFWFWMHDVALWVIVAPLAMWGVLRLTHISSRELGFISSIRGTRSWPHAFALASAAMISLPIAYWIANVTPVERLFAFIPTVEAIDGQVMPMPPLKWGVVGYMAITAGIIEEFFYRALPYALLVAPRPTALRKWMYVLATSLVFGLVHWEQNAHFVGVAFVFGMVAATWYLRVANVYPLMVGHTATSALWLS